MFPLRRYLSKVFSLSYHFDSLLKNVAYSFRMGPALQKLTVKRIEPISLNFSIVVSDSIIRQSLADSIINNSITEETLDDAVSTTMAYLHRCPQFDPTTGLYTVQNSRVHCEALLLRHHLLHPDFPPFNYFAVSKLCCYACYTLFHAYNESAAPGEHKYFTKGCHNKLYPLWPVPWFGDPKDSHIRSRMQEHFAIELRELLRDRQNFRAGSDSTDVSASSPREPSTAYAYFDAYDVLIASLDNSCMGQLL